MIKDGQRVSLEYTLTLDNGEVADTNVGGEALVYEHGQQQILPKLEAVVAELGVGDSTKATLSAEDGYGTVDTEAYREVPLDMVPEEARQVDMILGMTGPDGSQHTVRVHEINDDKIVLDLNHPLAGETLHFDVKVIAVE